MAACDMFLALVEAVVLRGGALIGHRRQLGFRRCVAGVIFREGGCGAQRQCKREKAGGAAHGVTRHSRSDCELPPIDLAFMVKLPLTGWPGAAAARRMVPWPCTAPRALVT